VECNYKKDWRSCAAWGSLICGLLGLLLTLAAFIYADFIQKRPYDIWEARYILLATPISFSEPFWD
jgi:hypothetical protein